jgi:outer membrane murein-binding lipoprotein Lpp
MKRLAVYAVSACIVLAGCATASKDISAAYVSPMQFQSYDCEQLASETQRIQSRVVQLGGRLDTAASNDKAIAGVGLILFWPALFALGGTKQQEADYARLRGEYDAVQQSAILKKCPGIVGSPAKTV